MNVQAPMEERKKRSKRDIVDDIAWGRKRLKEIKDELEYLEDRVHGDMMYLEVLKAKDRTDTIETETPTMAITYGLGHRMRRR